MPVSLHYASTILDAKAELDKEWEKLEKLPAWQVTQVQSKKVFIGKAQKEGRTVTSLCNADGLLPPQELGVTAKVPKNTRGTSCSVVTL